MRTCTYSRALVLAALGLASLGVGGCSSAADDAGATTSDDNEIIGGQDAFEPTLDAVVRLDTPSGSFCSGTLVAPRLVLTAAHCLVGYDGRGQERAITAHVMSYDARGAVKSEHAYEAAAVLRFGIEQRVGVPGHPGKDIALVMLAQAVPAAVAKPIPVRSSALSEADVGKTFLEVGYGQTRGDEAPSSSQPRQKGDVKVNAVSGKAFQKMFPSRAAFDAHLTALEDAAFVRDRGDELWNQELYAYGQEVQVGGNTSVQGCYGDSGGALLERVGDHYEVVAVASNGPEGRKNPCILGERFARADAQVLDEVRARLTEEAPWSSVPCDGGDDATARCTSSGELVACRTSSYGNTSNLRQRVERCEERGLTCTSSGATAACK